MTTATYFARAVVWFAVVLGAMVWGFSLRLAPCFPGWYVSLVTADYGCVHGLALGSLASLGLGAACFAALGPWTWGRAA